MLILFWVDVGGILNILTSLHPYILILFLSI